jgi:hypothetical protein
MAYLVINADPSLCIYFSTHTKKEILRLRSPGSSINSSILVGWDNLAGFTESKAKPP